MGGETSILIWIAIALFLFILQVAAIIIAEYRHPEKAVTWLIVLFLIPLIGFLPYYFVENAYSRHHMRRKDGLRLETVKAGLIDRSDRRIASGRLEETFRHKDNLHALLRNLPTAHFTACNKTTVYTEGRLAFEAMLEAIATAKHHIHVQFYIIRDDDLGVRFERLLIRKAQEGVQVRILYDGIGTRRLGKAYLNRLKRAGVEAGCFFPLLTTFFDKRVNYRNHRKIVVVDGKTGFFGGLNIGDEYLGEDPTLGYWRDTHFRMEGDSVLWIQYTFLTDWHIATRQMLTESAYYPIQDCQGDEFVQIVKSDPGETMLTLIFSLIVSAKKRIWMETPYFIPDPGIRLALKTAVKSGVDVRVIIPETPDKQLVYNASLSYVQEMLDAGVRFYRYQKGFLHAKVIVADDLACSGSANMDIRSFCAQFELNAVFLDKRVVERLVHDFYTDLGDSEEVLPAEFAKRSSIQKMKEVFSRLLSPLF